MIFKIRKYLKKHLPPKVFEALRYLYNLRFLVKLLNIDLNDEYKNTVIISGTGRSGTTWVANILNYDNEYRYMFEPFNFKNSKRFEDIGELPYFSPSEKDENIYGFVKKILSGRIRSSWINKYNKKWISRHRLIKDIYLNLQLNWIKKNFPEIPLILLLRHPFAVAYSMTILKWWDADEIIMKYLKQKYLAEDFLKERSGIVKKLNDDFSKFVFIWCIENIVPLSQFDKGEIHLAFYEKFCQDPLGEGKRMFDFLGKKVGAGIKDAAALPSEVVREDSAILKGHDLIKDWKDKITRKQIKSAMEILELFGLNKIYSEDILPDVGAAYDFLGFKKSI